jgi:hypothetical protein
MISPFLVFLDPLGNLSALIIKFLHRFISSLLAFVKVTHACNPSLSIKNDHFPYLILPINQNAWECQLCYSCILSHQIKFDETPQCSLMNLESYEPKPLVVYLQNFQNLVSSRIGQILTSQFLVILTNTK